MSDPKKAVILLNDFLLMPKNTKSKIFLNGGIFIALLIPSLVSFDINNLIWEDSYKCLKN